MLTIEFTEHGRCVADLKADQWVDDIIKSTDFNTITEIQVGTSVMIDSFRVAVKENKINSLDIVFKFKDELIVCNSFGKIGSWPKGFCDTTMINLAKLAKLAKL